MNWKRRVDYSVRDIITHVDIMFLTSIFCPDVSELLLLILTN